jgi:hypothetical protein
MNELITTGIDQVVARPGPGRCWTICFRSANGGLHHQLYANGRLAAWTDSTQQRHFFLDEPLCPTAIRIAAVAPGGQTEDLAAQLPEGEGAPTWIYRPQVLRAAPIRSGDVIEVLSDHATGTIQPQPLAQAEAWPVHLPRWAFGQDRFGKGGFGYDGADAPGLGAGAFGAGPFGFDADLIALDAPLEENGTHQIVLRTRAADGQVVDSAPMLVPADPPPPPPLGLTVLGYDSQSQQLTLQVQ